MSDGNLLLGAVLANPKENSTRLVYADWLEENGGARGERRAALIRLMCANPKVRLTYDGGWNKLPAREPWPDMRAALYDLLDELLPERFVLHRGFVSQIESTCEQFLKNAAALFLAHPIAAVRLSDRAPLRSGPTRWGWYASFDTTNDEGGPMTPQPHWIGEGIGGFLTGARITRGLPLVRWYATQRRASAALGRACLAFGRAGAARLRARS
jgi:uncharacterized protein (TIGR02996 family)